MADQTRGLVQLINGIYVFTDSLPDEAFLALHQPLPISATPEGIIRQMPFIAMKSYLVEHISMPNDLSKIVDAMKGAYDRAIAHAARDVKTKITEIGIKYVYMVGAIPDLTFQNSTYIAHRTHGRTIAFSVDPRKLSGNYERVYGHVTVPLVIIPYKPATIN